MSECFLCARLTEAARAAEAKAEEYRAEVRRIVKCLDSERTAERRARVLMERAMLDALRAIHGPPPLVFPHVAPRASGAALPPGGRFALLELE